MRIQELPTEAVFEALASDSNGLSASEAERRLAEYGPNRVERVRTTPFWLRFVRQFTHLFALVLWAAAAMAGLAEIQQPGEGMGLLAAAIVLVILINGGFAFWQEYRSERALDSLRKLLPHRVKVRRDAIVAEIFTENLVPGDLVLLSEGDAIPADCRVIHAIGVQVNMAAVTGESVPQGRDAHPDPHAELTSAGNILPAGISVVSGQAEAVVFATGMRTLLGGIAHLTQTAGERPSPLQREVVRLSRIIAGLAAGLGAAFFAIGVSLGMSWWQASIFAIGLMVANVPEGLLPTVTLALAMAGQRLARKNVLVRRLAAVETLGSTTVICTDKTGTLTENCMVAREVFVDGVRLPPSQAQAAGRLLFETASLCHTLEFVAGRLTGDPTEIALVEMAGGPSLAQPLDGIAFDPARRRMSLLHAGGEGNVLHVKGALDAVLPLCRLITGGTGARPLTDADRTIIRETETTMADAGLRVLALARREIPAGTVKEQWEENLIFLGLAALEDPARAEVPAAIVQCRRAGIKVVMVTGDHPRTAEAIARKIGLVKRHHPRIIVGEHLQRMSKTQLQLALDSPELIFARTRADQKWRIVEALQAKGAVVAVTGDGVNDAPALKQADIGIAMGVSGTEVAREAADMILLDDNFASIVAGIEEGRTVFDNIRKFLTYILTSNIPEIVPYLLFAVLDVPLALSIVQILAVDLGTDMLPALALAVEKPEREVMDRAPRSRGQRLIDAALLGRAYGFLGFIQAAGAMTAFFVFLVGGGWSWGADLPPDSGLYRQATTACLATIVMMQMANLFICRSRTHSAFVGNPFGNRMFPVGLIFEGGLIAAIVYSPLGNALFATAPIPADAWGRAAVFALGLLAAEEARKALVRVRGS